MAKWGFKEERRGSKIEIRLLRDDIPTGFVRGSIIEPAAGPKYFEGTRIWVYKKYQREYMKAHNRVKMGEALGSELLKRLKEKGISYIKPYGPLWRGERFVDRAISTGIIEKTPDGRLFRINWDKIPASEAARMELIQKVRANEAKAKADARAAKIKRVREWVKRLFRRIRPR